KTSLFELRARTGVMRRLGPKVASDLGEFLDERFFLPKGEVVRLFCAWVFETLTDENLPSWEEKVKEKLEIPELQQECWIEQCDITKEELLDVAKKTIDV